MYTVHTSAVVRVSDIDIVSNDYLLNIWHENEYQDNISFYVQSILRTINYVMSQPYPFGYKSTTHSENMYIYIK